MCAAVDVPCQKIFYPVYKHSFQSTDFVLQNVWGFWLYICSKYIVISSLSKFVGVFCLTFNQFPIGP